MSPEAVVTVERNYVRFGLAGLIVARLLPGFRSFTAPFAGLMRLGPVRTLVPIGIASALWYGGSSQPSSPIEQFAPDALAGKAVQPNDSGCRRPRHR